MSTDIENAIAGAAVEPEYIYAPITNGLDAEIEIAESVDGWRSKVAARLPEATCALVATPAESRDEAIVNACEVLIAWLSEQKEIGGKRHKAAAEALQDWALGVAKAPPRRLVKTEKASLELPVQMVPIEDLHESAWNPRQYYPEAAMAELVESMRTSGFREWLPLLVRPREDGGYEIGAGHRRRRAAEIAGIKMVPCIVRDMTDEQFLDVLNFDNTGREDVHPLHEAAGWRTWMARTGKGVIDIANRIGQSKEYVYQRLKYEALIEPARKAFFDGEITDGHAILIARREPKVQEKALRFTARADWQGHRPSVRALAQFLREEADVDLRDCPFARADRSLVAEAGACDECLKRAANIPGFELDPSNPEGDICTDRSCYQHKVNNHLFQLRTDLEAKGAPVVLVSREYSTRQKGVHNFTEYVNVKPGDKGARPALVVEGHDIGQVVHVRLKEPSAQPSAAQPGSASKPKRSAAEEKDAQEKAAQERKAKDERELAVRRAILRAVTAKVGGLTRADVEALLAVALDRIDEFSEELCCLHGIKFESAWRAGQDLENALPKMPNEEINRLVVEVGVICDFDEYQLDEEPEALLAVAKRYKVDAAKIRREMEDAAKEAEGGTRREVAKQQPAAAPVKRAPAKKATSKKTAAKPAAKYAAATRKAIADAQKKRWQQHQAQVAKKKGK